LTYRDVGDHTIAQTRYDNIYAVGNGRRTQEEQVQLREDILHLKAAGKKNKEIAAELGVSLGTVHFYGGPTPPKTNRKNPSLDEMNAEKERLEQRLVVLQAQIKTQADKITAQIEFQRLKVQWVDVDGERCVMVKKELNVLTLVPEDAAQLQELLEALFTSPAAETAA
jgi:hypothetical protein